MGPIDKIRSILGYLREVYDKRDLIRALTAPQTQPFFDFAPPGHFYSPIPDMPSIEDQADRIFDRGTRDAPAIALNNQAQLQLLAELSRFYGEQPFSEQPTPQCRYYLDNPFFSYGDGIVLYAFMRHFRPRRITEIGSGFSSAEMLDVNELFLDAGTEFRFIEPFPARLHTLLTARDQQTIDIDTRLVQAVPVADFAQLQANDILFIDSSHVAKTDSDVLHILFNILPSLNRGVIVHFHDVLWPFEYPIAWLQNGRAWNEAYFLRAFLQYNHAFEILYFNSYMAIHHTDSLRHAMPLALATPSAALTPGNTSLWLRKV